MYGVPNYLEILQSKRLRDYIEKACSLNDESPFEFLYPSRLYINKNTLDKAQGVMDIYNNLEMIEGDSIKLKTSLVPVPYKLQSGKISNLSMVDIGLLGTKGTKLDNYPLHIYSNWQKHEIQNEPWVRKTISPGWYVFVRGGVVDFCNLSWQSQISCLSEHSLCNKLNKIFGVHAADTYVAYAEIGYGVGCLDSLCCEETSNLPLRQSFLRTNSFFNDGTQIGILGSSYGFDVDGFWAGDGTSPNSSLCFCHCIQRY